MSLRSLAITLAVGSVAAFGIVQPASAAITWADLDTVGNTSVSGTVGGTSVTYTGDFVAPTRVSGATTDYWAPFPAADGPGTGPDPLDLIATNAGGLKTITFGQTVKDIYLAVNSWNGQSATFSAPFTIYAEGQGYWGTGTGTVSNGGLTLTSPNELHGILKFSGNFTSLSYTDVTENWHGIQIGIGGLAGGTGGVPEPATWAMMIAGFGLVGGTVRRRNAKTAVRFA